MWSCSIWEFAVNGYVRGSDNGNIVVKKITFLSEEYTIEVLFNQRDEKKRVVVSHPSPFYGGDMNNMVEESIIHAYHMKG